jgi:hypothetical protein
MTTLYGGQFSRSIPHEISLRQQREQQHNNTPYLPKHCNTRPQTTVPPILGFLAILRGVGVSPNVINLRLECEIYFAKNGAKS